jgi:Ca-activated chloride channel family protein
MAEDIAPNRLEVAKQVISDFTSKLKTDRVWLVLFSWKPFTSVPLTFDYKFITNYVKKITIKTINQDYGHLQWTAIWDALLYWANLFDEKSNREKVIVLLTDWEANKWIDPLEAIRYVKSKNIKVHTVWIGWNQDTFVEVKNIYWTQKIRIWWVDEENLKTIANLTSWFYYRADSKETFQQIFDKLNLLPKKEIEVSEYRFFIPYYKIFVYIIFFIFFVFISFNFYYYLRS